MEIVVQKEVFAKYPELNIIFILAKGIDNSSHLQESETLLAETEDLVRLTHQPDTKKNRFLFSPKKLAEEEFGRKAEHYHTSVERMLQKVTKKKSLRTSLTVSNILHYFSLKYLVPISWDDYRSLQGPMTFSLSTGKEKASLLRRLSKGELYYRDAKGIVGTKLDYWKTSRTAVSKSSSSVLIHLDFLPPVKFSDQDKLISELEDLLKDFCQADSEFFILNKRHNKVKMR
jgi:DNA/RNA-binding domain of Phe-tRNA-synthetase-like protein